MRSGDSCIWIQARISTSIFVISSFLYDTSSLPCCGTPNLHISSVMYCLQMLWIMNTTYIQKVGSYLLPFMPLHATHLFANHKLKVIQ